MQVVYAISPSLEGPTKIGITNTLRQRLEILQVGCWEKLSVVYCGAFYMPHYNGSRLGLGDIFVTSERAAISLEQAAHRKLKEMGFHIMGEWFDVSAYDAGMLIEKLAEMAGAKPICGKPLNDYIALHGPKGSGNRASYIELRRFIESLRFGNEQMQSTIDSARVA